MDFVRRWSEKAEIGVGRFIHEPKAVSWTRSVEGENRSMKMSMRT